MARCLKNASNSGAHNNIRVSTVRVCTPIGTRIVRVGIVGTSIKNI